MGASNRPADGQQGLDELKRRYEGLNKKKIQAETNLENALENLEDLRKEAREKYGTDDAEKLKALLAEMRAENAEKLRAYQAHLDRIEQDLAGVEAKFQALEGLPGGEEA